MNLLGAKLYDPAVAVTKNTTAALAMTALDTVNLRIAFTIPAHGLVRARLFGVIHGAATFPSVLLGVMNGATVVGRIAPVQSLGNTAVATALVSIEADFIIAGLAPGAVSWDAAYAVETLVAATGIKYGGPNDTVANNAFGAFGFEVWDPKPDPTNYGLLSIDANGRVDMGKCSGTAQTARDLGAQLDAAVSTRTKPADTQAAVSAVTGLDASKLDIAVSTRLAGSSYTAPLDASTTRAAVGLASANLDTQLSAIAGFVDNEVALILAAIDTEVAQILAAVDTEVAAIKAKTDQLTFTVPNQADVNVKSVKQIAVLGSGTEADPWHG